MAEGEVRIRYVADRSQFTPAVAAAQKTSENAVKAMAKATQTASQTASKAVQKTSEVSVKAAQKATKSAVKSAQTAAKASKKAIDTTTRATKKSAAASRQATRDAKEGFRGLIELAGISSDKVEKLDKVFAALTSPIGLVTLAATGAGLAIAGIGAGVVGAVAAAKELAKELEPIRELEGFGVTAAQLESIDRAIAAMKSVGAVLKQVVVILGAEFAPGLEHTATVMLKLSLVALDTFKAFADGHDVLRDFAAFFVNNLIQSLASPISTLMSIIEVMGDLATAVGAEGLGSALTAAGQSWDDFTQDLADGAVDVVFDATGAAIDRLDEATGDYDERAKKLIGTVKELGSEVKTTGEAAKKAAEQFKAFLKDVDLLIAASVELEFSQDIQDIANAAGALPASAVKNWQDLGAAVDELAPPETLSRLDQLQLLLLQLESEASRSAEAAEALAEPIERVTEALGAELAAGLDGVADDLDSIVGSMEDASETLSGRLMRAFESAKEAAQSVTGAADTLTGGAASSLGAGALIEAAGTGDRQAVNAAVDAGIAFVETLAENLPDLLATLAARVPDLIAAVVDAIPFITQALIEQVPDIIEAFILATPDIIEALLASLFVQLIPALPRIALQLGIAIGKAIWDGLQRLVQFFRDLIREIVTVGTAKTETFGDTPGPIRAPPEGLTARFAPGDFVIAARTPEGLRSQVGGAPSAPAPAAAPMAPMMASRVDLTDGHIAFDRLFKRNIRSGGVLASLGPGSTSQRSPFTR